MVDFASIEPLEQNARKLESDAVASAAAGYNIPAQLRSAVSERFANSPIQQQRDTALTTFLSSPERARADVAQTVAGGTILSPTQQQAIMAGQRAADIVPIASLNDLLASQFGSISDIVGAGTNAYNAQAAGLQGQATLARKTADSALKRLFDEAQLELEQQKLAASAAKSPLETLLAQMLMQQGAGANGVGSELAAKNAQLAFNFAPTPEAAQTIANNPGAGLVSVQGMTEQLPVYEEEGATYVDDQTGYSVTYSGGQWQPTQQGGGVGNWLRSIFGK